ncbi:MAG: hypothetical protein WDW38_000827 [Sanguina aurantia]
MAAGDEGGSSSAPVSAKVVEYDAITGVPSEFNEFLPSETPEYKRWKASLETSSSAPSGELQGLSISGDSRSVPTDSASGSAVAGTAPTGDAAPALEKKANKKKSKSKPMIVVEMAVRNKKKCTTSVTGLELFGVKLAEASKAFGKKFACGCSVTKTAAATEQIEMQGDFTFQLPDLLVKLYGKSNNVTLDDIKVPAPPMDDDDGQ